MKLNEGMKAPAFKGEDQDGNIISSKDYMGKKLVIYFYPADMTETCTIQSCNLRDNFTGLKKKGISIIGINDNPMKDHVKFAGKYSLPFPLLSDESHEVINKYGVWGDKLLFGRKYMGLLRTTFLIDEKGIIRKIIRKPKSGKHAEEIISSWAEIELT